jgi:hypothetical protein
MRSWYALAQVALLGVLCVACGAGVEPDDESEPPIGTPARIERATEIVLPLDTYVPSKQEYVTVLRAVWKLTSDCVARFGARYTASEDVLTSDVPPLDRLNERRYGLFSAELAARSGYAAPVPERPAAGSVGWDPTPNEKFLVVGRTGEFAGTKELPRDVNGTRLPADGCGGESWRKLADGARSPADPQLPDRLRTRAYDRAENDSRLRSAMSAWNDCMTRRGYSYTSIWGPNDRPWPRPPGADEIATATADVACKKETNLVGVWFTVEKAYQQRAVDRNAEALAVVKAHLQAQARTAVKVLARGG